MLSYGALVDDDSAFCLFSAQESWGVGGGGVWGGGVGGLYWIHVVYSAPVQIIIFVHTFVIRCGMSNWTSVTLHITTKLNFYICPNYKFKYKTNKAIC